MYVIQITLLALGIALLIGGYRKNNRNVFVSGFKEGFSRAREGHALMTPAQQLDHSFQWTPLRDAA